MKKGNILLLAGLILLVCSLVLVAFWQFRSIPANRRNQLAVQQIQALLPPQTPGITDQFSSMEMPALQIDGKNYIGLLDIPAFGVTLPVRSSWSSLQSGVCPCRFSGSVYDGSLILGGTDQEGQFDFLEQIQIGDTVAVTDMTGARFSYTVSRIQRAGDADKDVLLDQTSQLTLFARDSFSLEYIIVRCTAPT